MADDTRQSPLGMLIVEWSGASMLAGGTARPFGAEAWSILQRLARPDASGPGLIRTDAPGLVSGVDTLLEGRASAGTPDFWSLATDAPQPEMLRLESPTPEPEPAVAGPSRPTGNSLFPPRTRGAAPRSRSGAPRIPGAPAPTKAVAPSPIRPDATPRQTMIRPAAPGTGVPGGMPGPRSRPSLPARGTPAAAAPSSGARMAERLGLGAQGDLMAALRLRPPASTPSTGPAAASGGSQGRGTGLLSLLDVPRLAAAGGRVGEPPVGTGTDRSVVDRTTPDVEQTLLVGPALPAPEALSPTTATPARGVSSRGRPLKTPRKADAPAPGPAKPGLPSGTTTPAGGPRSSSRKAGPASAGPPSPSPAAAVSPSSPSPSPSPTSPSYPSPSPSPSPSPYPSSLSLSPAPSRHPGLDASWNPAGQGTTGTDALLRLMGPSLARLAASADGPDPSAGRTWAASEGVLSDASLLALGPDAASRIAAPDGPLPRRSGGSTAARGAPSEAGSPGPRARPGARDLPAALLRIAGRTSTTSTATFGAQGAPGPTAVAPRPLEAQAPGGQAASWNRTAPGDTAGGLDLMAAVLAPMGPALARLSSPEALRRQVGAADPFAALPAPAGFDGRWDLPGAPGALIALPVAADADVATGSLTGPGIANRGPAARRAATRTSPVGAPGSAPPGSAGTRTAALPSRRNLPLASMVRAGLRAADHPVSRTGFGVRPAAAPRRAPDSASPFPRVAGIGHPAPLDATAAVSQGGFGSAAVASAERPRSALGSGESGYQQFDLVGLRSPLTPAADRAFPAPAARAAEAFAPLRGTLVRSLAALPPPGPGIEGRAPSADAPGMAAAAGTSDLVEWIRLLGGGHPAATSQDAPVANRGRDAEGVEDGALVAPGAGPAIDRVRPEGIRGTSLPGLPSIPAHAPRFDVSRSDRSLVSPGGAGGSPGPSFASLLGSGSPSLSGPTYHGTHPLVSTALASVAATARLAPAIDTPAAAQAPGTAAAEPGAPGAQAVDLDGLAAEMSERILRRLKRDKERRGFYG